jgi:uncharacterized membrane protein YjfL (UPF0719 family)
MNFQKSAIAAAAFGLVNLASSAHAQSAASAAPWHSTTFLEAVGSTLVFGLVGIVLAIAGFKLFDLLTPFDLEKEICQEKNVAVGIFGGAIVLGVCYIVATAIS